jgi:hypothetical protein
VAAFGGRHGRHGRRLDAWIAAVKADDLPDVTPTPTDSNATTTPSVTASPEPTAPAGAVEGQVNRNMIKRQMFGSFQASLSAP